MSSQLVVHHRATADELGDDIAALIVDRLVDAGDRPFLLGLPSGRTPLPVVAALANRLAGAGADCSRVVMVMMDDYLAPGTDEPAPIDAHYSCRRFAEQQIRQVVNAGMPAAHRIPASSVWFPAPLHPWRYDDRIVDAGGVDVFLVASGASDGHVAFCGPGADLDGVTSVVELAPATRADNLQTFPDFASVDEVPARGVAVGLGTIRRHSRLVLMLLHGADKRESARRITSTSGYDPTWPATFVHDCPHAELWLDDAAAALLDPHHRHGQEQPA